MKLLLRCTQARVSPSDTSGFVVELEVADAEEARAQMLRGPDDGADDWPLAKRYGEVCDRVRALEKEVADLKAQSALLRARLSTIKSWWSDIEESDFEIEPKEVQP